MAKTKPSKKSKKGQRQREGKSILNGVHPTPTPRQSSKSNQNGLQEPPEQLLAQATDLLSTQRAEEALEVATKAHNTLAGKGSTASGALASLNLLGEIQVELGNIDAARQHFLEAVELESDEAALADGTRDAEKYLWLAQLSEEGGADSVSWFEKGAQILREGIAVIEENLGRDSKDLVLHAALKEKKHRLSNTLCGVAEIFMTDLSWEADAEERCDSLVTEAVMLTPESPDALQTLASVRISQLRTEDARAALQRSLSIWKDLPPESDLVPEYATRVSLTRLLLETEKEEDAIKVLDRLILEDDQSIEVWYLGGWAFYLLGDKARSQSSPSTTTSPQQNGHEEHDTEEWRVLWSASREWLHNALKLFEMLGYEDDRLKEHALELLTELNETVGEVDDDAAEDEWTDEEDDSNDGDEDMETS